MDPVARLNPMHVPDAYVPRLTFAAVSKFNADQVAARNHNDSVEWVVMPGRSFSWLEVQSNDKAISAMV
jgi:hypothetical protein